MALDDREVLFPVACESIDRHDGFEAERTDSANMVIDLR
jgi:hypothetical protein